MGDIGNATVLGVFEEIQDHTNQANMGFRLSALLLMSRKARHN